MDICENCGFSILENCKKDENNKELCRFSKKEINIIAGPDLRIIYDDIINVKKFVEMMSQLEKDNVEFKILVSDKLRCPICNENIFLSVNGEQDICITCYRKFNTEYGWCDLDYYDMIQDMIIRQTVRQLQGLCIIENVMTNPKNNLSNFGDLLLDVDRTTIDNINRLLDDLNQESLEFENRYDVVEFVKGALKKYGYDLIIENNIKDDKDSYDIHVNSENRRILDGFIGYTGPTWMTYFRYPITTT